MKGSCLCLCLCLCWCELLGTCCVESLVIGQGLALEHERLLCHRDIGFHLHCKEERQTKVISFAKIWTGQQGAGDNTRWSGDGVGSPQTALTLSIVSLF
jgi:hypothetical protein